MWNLIMTSSLNAAQEVTYALAASATLPAKLWRQNSEVNSPVVELSDNSHSIRSKLSLQKWIVFVLLANQFGVMITDFH